MKFDWKTERKALIAILLLFLAFFYIPLGRARFDNALMEGLYLAKWYAREHILSCLVPAFFIAGAIAVFINQASIMRYLGAGANKVLSYGVASVSGTVLAVCSCTVLPLFAGIYLRGAGLGPATAFLYSGPAINVLAIVLTARVLGLKLGIARAVGAIVFSIIIGLMMHLIFRREEAAKADAQVVLPEQRVSRPLWKNTLYFAVMVVILVFANWARADKASGLWYVIYINRWTITAVASVILGFMLIFWFKLPWIQVAIAGIITAALASIFSGQPVLPFTAAVLGLSLITARRTDETGEWFSQTWGFARQILPLLLAGVLIAGFLLGRPGHQGIIPSEWVTDSVGGNTLSANLFASVAGAFMYFATLTEVPILQGLIDHGMGKGPALALLLAGPALSLPSMLVIRSVMGTKKTVVFVMLVIIMATITGLSYGYLF
jgi:uncharacterized membrane protein YraQ (UPF0718 family)